MNPKATIPFEVFAQVDMRVGTIIKVEDFPEARKPAYKLQIDFGESLGIKKSSAQITDLYPKEDLIGKQIIAVVNFEPRQIGPFMSEVLVLGLVGDERGVVLLEPNKSTKNGLIVS